MVRLKISTPPLVLLALLFVMSIMLKVARVNEVAQVLPITFVFVGILVIAFGAFFDFGASKYLQNLVMAKMKIEDQEILNIRREQFIMSLIYAGIGFLFIASGVALTFIYGFIG